MITSKKLTAERLAEIKRFPVVYDDDSPKLTKEQIARMKPRQLVSGDSAQVLLSIEVDADVLAWFKTSGSDYQTRMSAVLREAMLRSR